MPFYINASGKPKQVKNLGWLLKHAREVETIAIIRMDKGRAELIARARKGKAWQTYVCDFASVDVCRKWVKRPCLSHATVYCSD